MWTPLFARIRHAARARDFVAQRVNWDPKPGNLASLAEELEVGLDTFILIDDNPKEVQEVQAGAPQVLALLLPRAPRRFPPSSLTYGPSTARVSPPKIAAAVNCTSSARSALAPRAPRPAWKISSRRFNWKSPSHPWRPRKWSASPNSRSAPTR